MSKLFVVNKPIFLSSNSYINRLKRRYRIKKIGYSGTLDPFATGCLIVATDRYTKLLPYLDRTPKVYRATLWLGATSESFDIENIRSVKSTPKMDIEEIKKSLLSLKGELKYTPPKYSAKKISGERAYRLAREKRDFELKKVSSTIYEIALLHYTHPFVHFEISISEGGYIRSIGQILAKKLKVEATLSSLRRVREGSFRYEGETLLNPLNHLNIPKNMYKGSLRRLELGKRLSIDEFENQTSGRYWIDGKKFFSIVEIKGLEVSYRLNLVEKF